MFSEKILILLNLFDPLLSMSLFPHTAVDPRLCTGRGRRTLRRLPLFGLGGIPSQDVSVPRRVPSTPAPSPCAKTPGFIFSPYQEFPPFGQADLTISTSSPPALRRFTTPSQAISSSKRQSQPAHRPDSRVSISSAFGFGSVPARPSDGLLRSRARVEIAVPTRKRLSRRS